MNDECEHKFKIYKEFVKKGKNFLGQKTTQTIYHMQCEKCGAMKTQIADGAEE